MPRLVKFSNKPYKEKKEHLDILEQNKKAFEQDMKERRRWKIRNSFNDKPFLDRWANKKKSNKKEMEDLIISSIALIDASETASSDLALGLGIKETVLEMDAVEDLAYNIYLVKLAEIVCSKSGANLNRETASVVMKAVIAQLFPPPMPMKPPPSTEKGDRIMEQLLAIKNSRGS